MRTNPMCNLQKKSVSALRLFAVLISSGGESERKKEGEGDQMLFCHKPAETNKHERKSACDENSY